MFYLDINFISDVSLKTDEKNANEMVLDIEYIKQGSRGDLQIVIYRSGKVRKIYKMLKSHGKFLSDKIQIEIILIAIIIIMFFIIKLSGVTWKDH